MKYLFLLLPGMALLSPSLPLHKPQDDLKESIDRGKTVYIENCISCHQGDGSGVPQAYPPLAQSDFLTQSTPSAIRAVKYGLSGPIKVNGVGYDSTMPETGLGDEDVADVMNYILNTWGNTSEGKIITTEMVQGINREE